MIVHLHTKDTILCFLLMNHSTGYKTEKFEWFNTRHSSSHVSKPWRDVSSFQASFITKAVMWPMYPFHAAMCVVDVHTIHRLHHLKCHLLKQERLSMCKMPVQARACHLSQNPANMGLNLAYHLRQLSGFFEDLHDPTQNVYYLVPNLASSTLMSAFHLNIRKSLHNGLGNARIAGATSDINCGLSIIVANWRCKPFPYPL